MRQPQNGREQWYSAKMLQKSILNCTDCAVLHFRVFKLTNFTVRSKHLLTAKFPFFSKWKNFLTFLIKLQTMLGTFIANVFFPRRDLVYFELYFEYWRRATAPATNRLRLNNSREAWIIRLMIFLCCLEFLKYTYIVGNQSHSITTRILLYDGFSLLLPNQDGLSAVTLIGIFMIIQLAWLTYFKGEKWAFESLGDMILRNRAPTFLWRDGNPLNPAASRKNVCDQLIRFVRLLLPFGQLITVFVCK